VAERILIYRIGSLGDTVVALPVFHMLAREFPDAERRVLTNMPVNSDAAPIQAVLGDGGFVHGYFPYPLGTRNLKHLNALRRDVANWAPDLVVYLNEPRRWASLVRDFAFLKSCGAKSLVGVPFARDLRHHRPLPEYGLFEAEASRLARCVNSLGEARIDDPANWSLNPTAPEIADADAALADWRGAGNFAAFAIGAKIDFKSWGDNRWADTLSSISAAHPDLGLALLGGPNDSARATAAASGWQGPVIDLCGKLPPRQSALVIGRSRLFLGHDSGPMHLAASMGTPSVCVFSKHAKPGVWFPFGHHQRILYPGLDWSGGEPLVMRDATGEQNITQIPATHVIEAANKTLNQAVVGANGTMN